LQIVRQAKPELAVLNHFGMQMLNRGPEKEASRIQEETGIKTIAARDGMTLDLKKLDEEVKQLKLGNF
ncbi:MAG: MBL fold metallo-hydrolase, partial [Candidatus Altiarchaeota archaeon]|nr:MBL fold metallo-hydrolase [Candidatus Altiarchaeota archaeon]